jgi:hypothetical protein
MTWITPDDGDVYGRWVGGVGKELPQVRGASVAQRRTGAAGEDRGNLTGASGRDAMTDQIDAAM